MKLLFLFLGFCFFVLGIIGAFLPVLPTTPFMILALWCFARSSDRLHTWLYNHRLFGPTLQRWDKYRVIPPIAKFAAVSAMIISYVYIIISKEIAGLTLVLIGLFMAYSSWYILSKPSHINEAEQDTGL
ncbi:YbaN family protein [Magnetococcales bacterium HHB-1]